MAFLGLNVQHCLKLILGSLELEDRLRADLVCRSWHKAVNDLWKEMPITAFQPSDFNKCGAAQFHKIIKVIGSRLQRLSLDNVNLSNGSWIDSIVDHCSNSLTHLSLVGVRCRSSQLLRLGEGLKHHRVQLKFLSLRGLSCSRPSLCESTIASFLSNVRVEELDIRGIHDHMWYMTQQLFPQRQCQLKKFWCSNKMLSSSFVEALTRDCGATIEQFSIDNCHPESGMFSLFCQASARTLTTLEMTFVKCFPSCTQDFDVISQLTNLTHLTFTQSYAMHGYVAVVNDRFIDIISAGCQQLICLNICGSELTDAGVIHLKRLDKLEQIDLAQNGKISDCSVEHLGELQQLKRLHLCGCTNLQGAFIGRILGRCQHLEMLGLYGCRNVSPQLLNASIVEFIPVTLKPNRLVTILTRGTHISQSWLFGQKDINGLKVSFDESSCIHIPLRILQ